MSPLLNLAKTLVKIISISHKKGMPRTTLTLSEVFPQLMLHLLVMKAEHHIHLLELECFIGTIFNKHTYPGCSNPNMPLGMVLLLNSKLPSFRLITLCTVYIMRAQEAPTTTSQTPHLRHRASNTVHQACITKLAAILPATSLLAFGSLVLFVKTTSWTYKDLIRSTLILCLGILTKTMNSLRGVMPFPVLENILRITLTKSTPAMTSLWWSSSPLADLDSSL
jgi:hypothetical protein